MINKFSILESNKVNKFKVEAKVTLIIECENEGEAGYIADSELGSISSQIEFKVLDIQIYRDKQIKDKNE